MCHHTREPTVLPRVSCRPLHLNIDRFHQPCLLPWRTSGVGEDCPPRTTWRPLALAGNPVFPPCATNWRFLSRRPARQDVNSPFSPLRVPPHGIKVFAHTQVRDPRGPPPPVLDMPWVPGHPNAFHVSNGKRLSRLSIDEELGITSG